MKLYASLVALFFAFCHTAPEALAQAKVRFTNNSLHLVYLASDTRFLLPADVALAGQVVPAGGLLPSGVTLAADLWGGTSSTALTKLSTTTFSLYLPGQLDPRNVLTSLAPGTNFFQVQVYDVAAGSYDAARSTGFNYYGESPVFSTVTGATIVYNSIVRLGAPAYSTWAPGDWNLDDAGYGEGALGAISIQAAPEPSLTGLLGLGVALVLGRKKAVRARATGPSRSQCPTFCPGEKARGGARPWRCPLRRCPVS